MTSLLRSLRQDPTIGLDEYAEWFGYNGSFYPTFGGQSINAKTEEVPQNFLGYVQHAYKSNGVIFACMLVRQLLFSEARFQYRRMNQGRPGDLFGDANLQILETPWSGGTTGDLLTRAIQDADLAGNFYGVRRGRQIKRLRPDWVSIVLGSNEDPEYPGTALDAEILGYLYHPGGPAGTRDPIGLLPNQVAHFAPIPDPEANYRGMSWLTPVLSEITADRAATTHKRKFFENGATPNLMVKFGEVQLEAFQKWIDMFKRHHEGAANAYKTLFLGAGGDAKVLGADLQQADFKVTQGAGETRIAAAAGVPPVIVGLSEGLDAATYSNYSQARRRFADGTMRPLWRNMAGSMARIVDVPNGAELWYDDRDISFLQEDQKDEAEIRGRESSTIKTLVDAGFEPETVIAAVDAGDWSKLVHTGLYSVQLQPPNPEQVDPASQAGRMLAELVAPHLNGEGH